LPSTRSKFPPNCILDSVSDIDGSSGAGEGIETDALVSRLRLIEDQPLESRASAFAQIHEELQSRLESGD
jgi:hypothetical protein